MRIGGVASSDNTSDILTKNLQPHLHQRHCAVLHILQPTLTQSNVNLTDGSRESSGGEDMSLVLKATNLKIRIGVPYIQKHERPYTRGPPR